MSTMSFSDLTNILYENYGSLIAETVVQQGPGNWLVPGQSILGRLRELGQVGIGSEDGNDRHVKDWGVHFGTASAVAIDGNDTFPSATQEQYDKATIDWRRIVVSMDFDNLLRLATRRNSTRGGVNPISNDFKKKLKALVHKVETDLAGDGTGTSGKDLQGLKSFISTSATYGGIDQSAKSWWRAAVTDASSAGLSVALLNTVASALWDRNAIGPRSEIWMSSTQWKKYVGLFTPNMEYRPAGSVAQSVEPVFSNGYVTLPIQILKGVEADEVLFVNPDEISVRFLDHTPEDDLAAIRDEEVMHEGMPVGFEKISTNSDKKQIAMKMYCNMVCDNPYHQGALINLAT